MLHAHPPPYPPQAHSPPIKATLLSELALNVGTGYKSSVDVSSNMDVIPRDTGLNILGHLAFIVR